MSKSHYIIPIFVPHVGCPHECVFCNQNSITGVSDNEVNSTTTRNIIDEYLSTIDRKNSIVEVSFYGGTFTAIPMNKQKELLAVAKHYKDAEKIDFIHLSTRPDYIDDVILKNLNEYSVDIIELGVQSMDNDVLLKSGRGHSSDDVIKASKLIKEYGFILGHQIMIGLPGADPEKDIKTAKEVIKLKPDIARIYPALVIKDTPMEKMYKSGLYKPYTLSEAVKISRVIYAMFVSNDIDVIRIGLQPTEEINYGKDLISGPFHPSIRELVEGSIYNKIIYEKTKHITNKKIEIYINDKDLSKLYANKKEFFNDIKLLNKTNNFKVIQDKALERGSLLLKFDEKNEKISINEYLKTIYKEGELNIL